MINPDLQSIGRVKSWRRRQLVFHARGSQIQSFSFIMFPGSKWSLCVKKSFVVQHNIYFNPPQRMSWWEIRVKKFKFKDPAEHLGVGIFNCSWSQNAEWCGCQSTGPGSHSTRYSQKPWWCQWLIVSEPTLFVQIFLATFCGEMRFKLLVWLYKGNQKKRMS